MTIKKNIILPEIFKALVKCIALINLQRCIFVVKTLKLKWTFCGQKIELSNLNLNVSLCCILLQS